jgi:hypothetical protein
MKRAHSIQALLRKASSDCTALRAAYAASLHEHQVNEDLKVGIKNILENLRSCLDYLAHDIFETHCSSHKKPDRLYFPIRHTSGEFLQVISKDFPSLSSSAPQVVAVLESVQPYNDPWLANFNKLNNHNKHQELVEQTRTESKQTTVTRGSSSISWSPGVSFSSGISIMGVPIDARTQLPLPNNVAGTKVTIWVSFSFKETGELVIPFLEMSLIKVGNLVDKLAPLT